jgi:hypothetical protein
VFYARLYEDNISSDHEAMNYELNDYTKNTFLTNGTKENDITIDDLMIPDFNNDLREFLVGDGMGIDLNPFNMGIGMIDGSMGDSSTISIYDPSSEVDGNG